MKNAAWGQGPWDDEPDRVDFEHAGRRCLMLRNLRLGHWCGYVAVPPGHPYYGKDYDGLDVEVHGGLTYADACAGDICHKAKPGEPDDLWWLGFDCGHFLDLVPFRHDSDLPEKEIYRDVAYVRAECERLAEQLAGTGRMIIA